MESDPALIFYLFHIQGTPDTFCKWGYLQPENEIP